MKNLIATWQSEPDFRRDAVRLVIIGSGFIVLTWTALVLVRIAILGFAGAVG